jgi:FMN phosphatase YigB (HAD superfamily)
VLTPLSAAIGEGAVPVQATFAEGYATLIRQLRSGSTTPLPEYAALEQEIARWQRGVTEAGYELKMFSRHSLLAIALAKHGYPVTHDLIHASMDHYWQVLADETEMFADARAVIERLQNDRTPFLLATNSNGFLIFDEPAQTFRYDPEDAVRRKLARLSALRAIGIQDAQISIGDPIGKPDPAFYRGVLRDFERFHGVAAELDRAMAVGDSLTSDVLPMMKLGVRWGAWLQRQRSEPPAFVEPNVAAIADLAQLWSMDWPAG